MWQMCVQISFQWRTDTLHKLRGRPWERNIRIYMYKSHRPDTVICRLNWTLKHHNQAPEFDLHADNCPCTVKESFLVDTIHQRNISQIKRKKIMLTTQKNCKPRNIYLECWIRDLSTLSPNQSKTWPQQTRTRSSTLYAKQPRHHH